jgi:hypothetical protein
MVATPLGGVMLDRVLASCTAPEPRRDLRSSIEAAEQQLETVVLASEDVGEQSNERVSSVDQAVRSVSHADPDASVEHYKTQLHHIGKITTVFSALAVTILCLSYFAHDVGLFICMIAVGCGLIFCTYSAINMGVMLSVPPQNRAFGLAMNTIILHAIGDVPSPVIVGYIKDSLAPGCVADSGADDDEVASSPACRDDAEGLRLTMLFTNLWMWWTVFFFALAWWLNKKQWLTLNWCNKSADSSFLYCPLLEDNTDKADQKAKETVFNEVVVSELHKNDR